MNTGTWSLLLQFPYALICGLLIGIVCSLLGVFVILKRVVFIGITLSEVAACGIAGAFVLGLPPFLGAAALTLAAVAVLSVPFENRRVPRDAILGVLFALASASGVLIVSHSAFGLMEVKALLYGDLILASPHDFRTLCGVLLPGIAVFFLFIRPTLNAFLDRESAQVLGGRPRLWENLYFVTLGLAVSAASRTAGALLVFCYLVVSPATALLLTRRFAWVLAASAASATVATIGGLLASFRFNAPSNQTICVTACALCATAYAWRAVAGTISTCRKTTGATPPLAHE